MKHLFSHAFLLAMVSSACGDTVIGTGPHESTADASDAANDAGVDIVSPVDGAASVVSSAYGDTVIDTAPNEPAADGSNAANDAGVDIVSPVDGAASAPHSDASSTSSHTLIDLSKMTVWVADVPGGAVGDGGPTLPRESSSKPRERSSNVGPAQTNTIGTNPPPPIIPDVNEASVGFDEDDLTDFDFFSLPEILRLLRYIDASYIRTKDLDIGAHGTLENGKMTLIEEIQSEGADVTIFGTETEFKGILIRPRDGSLVIAYRGTADWNDVMTDLNFPMTHNAWASGRVHAGFNADFENTWEAVYANTLAYARSQNKDVRDLTMTVIGHSLGAAVATLTAYRFAKELGIQQNLRLLTIGSPRVLDWYAASDFENVVRKALRIGQHHADPVIAVSPGFLGYKHVGHYVSIDAPPLWCDVHKLSGYKRVLSTIEALPLPNNTPSAWSSLHSGKYHPYQLTKKLATWLLGGE